MDKHLLIRFECDYADEFDVSGFNVMTEEEWDKCKVFTKKTFDAQTMTEATTYSPARPREVEWYFGTNEQLIWTDYKDWLRCFKVEKITAGLATTLKGLFGYDLGSWHRGFGHFPQMVEE